MPLLLKAVEPARGARWVADAFRLYTRRPLAFSLLFMLFLFGVTVLMLVPLGLWLAMALVPLLSLGFMLASQSALLGGPVQPGQFIEPLRGDARRRNALLILCAIYGIAAMLTLWLTSIVAGEALERLRAVMAQGPEAPADDVRALWADPDITAAVLVGSGLAALLAVPFWHAPALVHWGAQGVAQALFSSTLAVWRSKGAFLVYMLAWTGVVALFVIVIAVIFAIPATRTLAPLVMVGSQWVLMTVFYVSLLFTFNDSFGSAAPADATPPESASPR
jgi:hypothetical protein